MFINVKSDIFQLGMVLWALAQQDDEPEHATRTNSGAMPRITVQDVPNWFEDIVDACLSNQPRGRPSARELLTMFPLHPQGYEKRRVSPRSSDLSLTSHNSHKEFNDPTTAVDWNAVEEFKRDQRKPADFVPSYPTTDPYQFINAATSTEYRIDSTGSYVIPHRGRSPHGYRRRSAASSTTSLSLSQGPPACEYLCDEDITGFGHAEDSRDDPANAGLERPSVPDVPPFQLGAFESYQKPDCYDQQSSRRAPKSHEGSPHPLRQHRVLFGPPVHQDSGFDEFMIENIEHGQPPTHPSHNLHPILTTTVEILHDDDQEESAVTQPSEPMTSPSTSQSQLTPITPFSHHAPSNRSEARIRDLDLKSST